MRDDKFYGDGLINKVDTYISYIIIVEVFAKKILVIVKN